MEKVELDFRINSYVFADGRSINLSSTEEVAGLSGRINQGYEESQQDLKKRIFGIVNAVNKLDDVDVFYLAPVYGRNFQL
jgi:hypothetical protein